MTALLWFYIISVFLFYIMLIIDGKNYDVRFKDVFKYYGFNVIYMFIPLINISILLLWVYIKITNFDKK